MFLNNTAQWGTNDSNTFTVNYVGGSYTDVATTLVVNQPLSIGTIVDIDTNKFQQVQKIAASAPTDRDWETSV